MQAKESEKCFNFSPLLWKTHMQGQIYVVLLNIHAPTLKGVLSFNLSLPSRHTSCASYIP